MLVKFRIPEIFFGALLTVAIFAMGFVVASSMPPQSQQIEKVDHPEAAKEGGERTAEKQIAYYTKWLAWFTLALVAVSGIQGYFLLRADKTARISADAANKSANVAEDAFRRLERPYLYVKITETHRLRAGQPYSQPLIEYSLVNYGKLPAILRSISVGFLNNPPFPLQSTMTIAETRYEVIESNGELLNFRNAVVSGSAGGQKFDGGDATNLILYGVLEYDDPTGAHHVDSFCMRGLPGGTAFTVDGGSEYNWHKTQYPETSLSHPT